MHLRRMYEDFQSPVKTSKPISDHTIMNAPFVCTHEGCDKSYFDKKHLSQHVKGSHTLERSYECNWEGCSKSFLTATRLRRACLQTHQGQNRFLCTAYPPCNQTFRKHKHSPTTYSSRPPGAYALPMHLRRTQLQEKPAALDSTEQAGLSKHEDRAHSLPRFFCPDCTLPGINPDGSAIHLGFTTDTQTP